MVRETGRGGLAKVMQQHQLGVPPRLAGAWGDEITSSCLFVQVTFPGKTEKGQMWTWILVAVLLLPPIPMLQQPGTPSPPRVIPCGLPPLSQGTQMFPCIGLSAALLYSNRAGNCHINIPVCIVTLCNTKKYVSSNSSVRYWSDFIRERCLFLTV